MMSCEIMHVNTLNASTLQPTTQKQKFFYVLDQQPSYNSNCYFIKFTNFFLFIPGYTTIIYMYRLKSCKKFSLTFEMIALR